jgi:histidinol-phosphate aminotransferase
MVLVDEAYHDYVTDPAYATAAPLALSRANVFITRTLSKAYGMAGLRIGYAVGQPKTIEALARYAMPYNQSAPGIAAAVNALKDQAHIDRERARNTEVRAFTMHFFESQGFKAAASQANFLFVDVGRPAKEFRDACRQHNVLVARDFPPLEKTHARVSIGTMEEMQRATEVFRRVLAVKTTTAGR